ncbi:MAG TPA: hypothetical protein VF527_10355 [Pyrinomonadaceae bacterium]
MPFKEDRDDASETRAGAEQPDTVRRAGDLDATGAHALRDTTRPESFSAHVFAERWSIVAGGCLIAAAALLLASRMDAAFVVATLGVVAWFWNERNRLRPRGIEANGKFRDEEEEFEDRDEE